jgi:hypothetical protein
MNLISETTKRLDSLLDDEFYEAMASWYLEHYSNGICRYVFSAIHILPDNMEGMYRLTKKGLYYIPSETAPSQEVLEFPSWPTEHRLRFITKQHPFVVAEFEKQQKQLLTLACEVENILFPPLP